MRIIFEEWYYHSTEKDEVELDRLTLQASIVDPVTIRHLETIGVAEGWRYLDVGAGAGSSVQWLSTRVGHIGKVVDLALSLWTITTIMIVRSIKRCFSRWLRWF
jgi:hypothetical protein